MKQSQLMAQQGDALFFKVSSLPDGLKERADKIAVDGLQRHIAYGDETKVFEGYISTSSPCVIRHPEHKDVVLEPGNYRIEQVLEYDHWLEESRRVID